jgi:hypothetical protein
MDGVEYYVRAALYFALGNAGFGLKCSCYRVGQLLYVVLVDRERRPVLPCVVLIKTRPGNDFYVAPHYYETIYTMRVTPDWYYGVSSVSQTLCVLPPRIAELFKRHEAAMKPAAERLASPPFTCSFGSTADNYDAALARISVFGDLRIFAHHPGQPSAECLLRVVCGHPRLQATYTFDFAHEAGDGVGWGEMVLRRLA